MEAAGNMPQSQVIVIHVSCKTPKEIRELWESCGGQLITNHNRVSVTYVVGKRSVIKGTILRLVRGETSDQDYLLVTIENEGQKILRLNGIELLEVTF